MVGAREIMAQLTLQYHGINVVYVAAEIRSAARGSDVITRIGLESAKP